MGNYKETRMGGKESSQIGTESSQSVNPNQSECVACLRIVMYINTLYQKGRQDLSIEDVERAVNQYSLIFKAPACKFCNLCPRARKCVITLQKYAITLAENSHSEVQLKGLLFFRALAIVQMHASGLQAPLTTIGGLIENLNTQPWTIEQGATILQEDAAMYLRKIYQAIEELRNTLHLPQYATTMVKSPMGSTNTSIELPEPALSNVGSNVMSLALDGDCALSEVALDIFKISTKVAALSHTFE
jgi:hypothetical protein